jgi:hypothetical protein
MTFAFVTACTLLLTTIEIGKPTQIMCVGNARFFHAGYFLAATFLPQLSTQLHNAIKKKKQCRQHTENTAGPEPETGASSKFGWMM